MSGATSINPINLAGVNPQSGKFEVNDNALSSLMMNPELKGRPLLIISIAGAYRSGKSFIMNFFMRYLREKGWKNSKWFGDKKKKVDGGFIYQSGSTACTQGIHVWPEVFSFPLEDGREAAVLMVDTQGLFDGDTSPDTNAKVMTVSTLFCSNQILNLKNQIEERDLEHLQLAVHLAKKVGPSKTGSKPFQTLLFLIRDWQWKTEYTCGDSTEGYYKSFFGKKSKSQEVEAVKQSIPDAFENVLCFLLPHPGKKVLESKDGKLKNKGLEEEFRKCAKKLVEQVFHPKNIVLKKTSTGEEATADDLMQMLASVNTDFKSGKISTAETLYQSTIRADRKRARLEGLKKYKAKMPTDQDEKIVINDEELKKRHVSAMKSAEQKFLEIVQMTSATDTETVCDRLKDECEYVYFKIKRLNQEKREKMKTQAGTLQMDCAKQFQDELEKLGKEINENESNEAFAKKCNDYKTRFENEFDARAKEFDSIAPFVVPIRLLLIVKMQDMIATRVDERQRQQELKKHIEESKRAKLELVAFQNEANKKNIEESKRAKLELVTAFQNEANKYAWKYEDNLGGILRRLKEGKMREYKERTRMTSQRDETIESNRKELAENLDKIFKKAMKSNEEMKSQLREQSEVEGRKFARILEDKLEEPMARVYIERSCFDSYTRDFLAEELEPNIRELPGWCKSIVRDKVNERAAELKKRNEINKPNREVTVDNLEVLIKIVSGFWEALTYVGSVVVGALAGAVGLVASGVGKVFSFFSW